jgi:hypothetical protein
MQLKAILSSCAFADSPRRCDGIVPTPSGFNSPVIGFIIRDHAIDNRKVVNPASSKSMNLYE